MKQDKRKRTGIRWRILGSFALFTSVILVLLWTFQVSLLDTFYRAIKTREIQSVANTLSASLLDDTLQATVQELAQSKEISVLVTNRYGETLINTNLSVNTTIHTGNPVQYMEIYRETEQEGGRIIRRYQSNPPPANTPKGMMGNDNRVLEHIILAQAGKTAAGEPRLILLQSNLTPVDATTQTLRVQLWCITLVMLLLSSVLAFLLTARISRPIIRINESAKALGRGNYDAHFDESGYREIAELGQTLNYTARELSKTEKLRRELIANVSHDLRTPLTMIAGYGEIMRDIPGENTPENLQIILDESHRLTTLVNDMLDLSKLQAGVFQVNKTLFSLTQLLRETVKRLEKLNHFQLILDAAEDLFVYADALKISQVLYNLIHNAIIHSGSAKMVKVRQSTDQNDHVRIEVIDYGAGIPPEQLTEIWERYYKTQRTSQESRLGSGLGLSIVKAILDLHGAQYGVTSKLGHGCTFWFSLPRMKANP